MENSCELLSNYCIFDIIDNNYKDEDEIELL